jgi:hypothetical protein
MDLWETPVSLCFKQQCQHLLGDFFRSLENAAPWFVSLGKPVNEEEGTCLYSLLGFEYEKGISFVYSIGLIKKGHSRNPEAISGYQEHGINYFMRRFLSTSWKPLQRHLLVQPCITLCTTAKSLL